MVMEREKNSRTLILSVILVGLVWQGFVVTVQGRSSLGGFSAHPESTSTDSIKKPDCLTTTPSTGSGDGDGTHDPIHGIPSPSTGSGGSYGTPTPSHGSGGSYTPTPPTGNGGSYGTPAPSHGNGGSYTPTPSTGSGGSYGTPTPSHGNGGSYTPTPSAGSGGSYPTPEPSHGTPTPSNGNGGYYNSPPSTGGSHPSAPVTTPPDTSTPSTPTSPTTPGISTPSPPIPTGPNGHFFTGSCDYWKNHPMAILAVLGNWQGTVGHFFGTTGTATFNGKDVTLQDALANTRNDGIGALLREGTAALLNSMANHRFPFTTQQVTGAFAAAATGPDRTAAAQAAVFKMANEGKLKF